MVHVHQQPAGNLKHIFEAALGDTPRDEGVKERQKVKQPEEPISHTFHKVARHLGYLLAIQVDRISLDTRAECRKREHVPPPILHSPQHSSQVSS